MAVGLLLMTHCRRRRRCQSSGCGSSSPASASARRGRVHDHRPERRAVAEARRRDSNLTFFRQVGGSVGLAIAGTVFATALRRSCRADRLARRPATARGPARRLAGTTQRADRGRAGPRAASSRPPGRSGRCGAVDPDHRHRRSTRRSASRSGQTFRIGVVAAASRAVAASSMKELAAPDDARPATAPSRGAAAPAAVERRGMAARRPDRRGTPRRTDSRASPPFAPPIGTTPTRRPTGSFRRPGRGPSMPGILGRGA